MGLETIIRPFQSPDYSPATRETAAGFTESATPVRLRPGLVGRGKSYHVSYSANSTSYAIRRPTEKQG